MNEFTARSGPVLLLSDLHLPASASPLRETFLRFLAGPAMEAASVYILGDLFEVWIGDDVGLATYVEEARALRRLTESGVAVHLQRGNRDFLLGRRFSQATGVVLLDDPVLVELFGVRTLLSHGDQWCTDDVGYQRWRAFAHHGRAQAAFLSLPRRLRAGIATRLRQRSRSATRAKPAAIMDVDASAIAHAFVASGAQRIIHGHTHRPAEHLSHYGRRTLERIVLADWSAARCEYLRCTASAPPQRVQL